MTSRLVTFRIPDDLYQVFQEKCSNEGQTASEKLRHFVDDYLYPSSQTQAASPAETDEVKEPSAEQPILEERITQIEERIGQLSTLEERITRVEEQILHLDEPLGEILDRLDHIEQVLPQALSSGAEDGSPEPGEIDIEEEHLDRVQGNQEEQREKKEEEPGKVEDEGHWPYNLFFKKKEDIPKENKKEKKDEGLG